MSEDEPGWERPGTWSGYREHVTAAADFEGRQVLDGVGDPEEAGLVAVEHASAMTENIACIQQEDKDTGTSSQHEE